MFVKPVEGRSVPDPERNSLLAPEGREVENSQYWQRRIADGDVLVGEAVALKKGIAE